MTVEYFSWGGGDAYGEYARACIHAMRMARPVCDECRVLTYSQAAGAAAFIAQVDDNPECRNPSGRAIELRMGDHGYELMHGCAGYVRRCSPCAEKKLYPWADKLIVEQVALVMREMHEHAGQTTLACSELKDLVEQAPYRYPVQTAIEHGQTMRATAFTLKPEELTDAASLVKQTEAKPKRGNVGPNTWEFL